MIDAAGLMPRAGIDYPGTWQAFEAWSRTTRRAATILRDCAGPMDSCVRDALQDEVPGRSPTRVTMTEAPESP
jgi:hypothetical protein